MAPPDTLAQWQFLLYGYVFTVIIEGLILLPGLSARHPFGRRIFAAFWLNACTYPVVVLVLPNLIDTNEHYATYLWVAETFAPVAECALFWAAFGSREEWGKPSMLRDLAVITAANLASFGFGVVMERYGIWPFGAAG